MANLPSPKYTSGDFTVITPLEVPRFSAPFENDVKRYVLNIRCRQFAKYYDPLPLNTTFPTAGIAGYDRFASMFANEGFTQSEFYLVRQSQPTPIGIELEFELTFAAVPDQRQEPIQYNFTYPGWITNAGVPRDPKTEPVNQAISVFDYFLVGSASYPTILRIPVVEPFRVFYKFPDLPDGSANDSYPAIPLVITATNNQTLTVPAYDLPVTVGGVTYPAYFTFLQSYKNKLANNQPITTADMLVAQANAPQIWMGQIYARQTIYVPPA